MLYYFPEDTKVKYYQEKSNPQLADFSPFDLDAWWGRRLYQVRKIKEGENISNML